MAFKAFCKKENPPRAVLVDKNAEDRVRTCAGTKPLTPQASPFDRSGTPALSPKTTLEVYKSGGKTNNYKP